MKKNSKSNIRFVVAMLVLMAVIGAWGCKKNPVDSLNLKKDHPSFGLQELEATTTYNSISVKVNATSDGGNAITERGFVWNTGENPNITDNKIQVTGSGLGQFSQTINGLWGSTEYAIKGYVINKNGTFYSNELKVTTAEPVPAKVTTGESFDVTHFTAKVLLIITDNGGRPILEKGIAIGTTPNPTVAISKAEKGEIELVFDESKKLLLQNEKAKTNNKQSLQKDKTSLEEEPELVKKASTNSGTQTPTLKDETEEVVEFQNLIPGTSYYVRAYVKTELGMSYGEQKSFTTKDGIIVLSTAEVTDIQVTSATSGGSITDDGGAIITERGIVWSTQQSPSITSNLGKTISGTGTGTFSATLSGLSLQTQYFVRSYATNAIGTNYGNELSFTTTNTFTNSIGMDFVYIESGSFYMGSTIGQSNEQPVHQVTLTQDFYMGKYEVTQKQWVDIMGSNPSNSSYGIGDNYPVNMVSWNDIQVFITKLNQKEGGAKYRLPTEAEWEYCAHAGAAQNGEGPKWSFGNDESQFTNYAWYSSNSGFKLHEIGTKLPNAFGLYDIHGNVYEWAQDWYSNYSSNPTTDPQGPSTSSARVLRGGGWGNSSEVIRSAFRSSTNSENLYYTLGFRLLRLQ